ncbi:MAG: hypothetical protein ACJAUJ_000833 [Salibacteraceae bacterium]|jgi:hypothetical protein
MQKERRDPMHREKAGRRKGWKAKRLEGFKARSPKLDAQCWLSTIKNPPAVKQLEIHNQFMAAQPFPFAYRGYEYNPL